MLHSSQLIASYVANADVSEFAAALEFLNQHRTIMSMENRMAISSPVTDQEKFQYRAELERNIQALHADVSEFAAALEFLNQHNTIMSMENRVGRMQGTKGPMSPRIFGTLIPLVILLP
ncbi:hypothetical protein Vadar_032627 [Vaccinium darrowii]|uniref:Uncharacterized protein n=1 Tax=Vaccinium darrowii TaxID=229202 RepID=A0ACB7Z8J0_9ERIC|nr:hypothetical protein Vadar_032627 [Vaccinium darrowii]